MVSSRFRIIEYVNNNFRLQLVRGNDYSKESPIYMKGDEILETDKRNGLGENKLNHQLFAYALVLHKK